jgi:hypothetical protein
MKNQPTRLINASEAHNCIKSGNQRQASPDQEIVENALQNMHVSNAKLAHAG